MGLDMAEPPHPVFGDPRPVGRPGRPYPVWVQELRRASGAYMVLGRRLPLRERLHDDRPDVMCWGRRVHLVGWSGACLKTALIRHLCRWDLPGALTYPRDRVAVAVAVCSVAEAQALCARARDVFEPEDMAA